MPLAAGTRLGPYEVLGPIGAGGMGEVYRARDPRLGREVAIKVLPADRLADESRRRRFVQEAQAASALNHPHIITIHEIETAGDHDFIVMEYVRGKSLDEIIPRQGLRLAEALRIAISVADALAAAHARGIIHRDLKPANVIVGTDGSVKVLDFGLAKLMATEEASDAETVTGTAHAGLTALGTVAGTAAYMAPEQATGGAVDTRSDIFAFGAMLYEMVTGRRAFAGTSTAETLTAVIRAQPKPPTGIVQDLPSDLEKVILRCLRKDPQRRFQHIDDVKVALQDIKEESDSGAVRPVPVGRRRRAPLMVLIATAVVASVAAAWLLLRTGRHTEPPPMRLLQLTTLTGLEGQATFSPDGEQVAFVWNGPKQNNWHIYVTLIGSSEVRRLTSDAAADSHPAWSPDGRQIAFLRERPDGTTIQITSALGGADRKLSDFRGADSLSWSADGQWLATGRSGEETGQPRGMYLIPIEGGEPRLLMASTQDRSDSLPTFSPDGRQLAYVSCNTTAIRVSGECDIWLLELNAASRPSASPRRLTAESPKYIDDLAWNRDGNAVVYSAAKGPAFEQSYLWRVGVDGIHPPERIEIAGAGARAPALAPSHDRLAFTHLTSDDDIYRFDVGRPVQWLVGSTLVEMEPRLSPNGRHLVFGSARSGGPPEIWLADADGSNLQQLTRAAPGHPQGSPYWSPDGRQIVFDAFSPEDSRFHIWLIDADGGTPRRLMTQAGDEHTPTWSHDGRWIYFASEQGGTARDVWRVSADGRISERLIRGGSGPFASETIDGKTLLFQTQDSDSPLMAMPLPGGAGRQLVACVKNSAFGVGPQGVYYVPCEPSPNPSVHVLNLETGRDRRLGTLDGITDRALGLSISPDGRTILYPKVTTVNADLMLIENFR
jgi:Tol biopolymer transport system component/predicted Ser/Thr protein kinase